MKNFYATLLFFCSVQFFALSQNCYKRIEKYHKNLQEYVQANQVGDATNFEIARKMVEDANKDINQCAFTYAKAEGYCKFSKLLLLKTLANYAFRCEQYDAADVISKEMQSIMPEPESISLDQINTFSFGQDQYTIYHTREDLQSIFYFTKELEAFHFFHKKKFKRGINHYEKIKETPLDYMFEPGVALAYADAIKKNGFKKEYQFKVINNAAKTVAAGLETNPGDLYYKKLKTNVRDKFESFAAQSSELLNCDYKGRLSAKASWVLFDLGEKETALKYARFAEELKSEDKDFGLFYNDSLARETSDKLKAGNIIYRGRLYLRENECARVKALYQGLNDLEKVKEIEKVEKDIQKAKKRADRQYNALLVRQKFSISPMVELVGIPLGYLPICLNIRTGRVWHEFRYTWVYGARNTFKFGQWADEKDKENRAYNYKGYDAGYTLSVITKGGYDPGHWNGRAQINSSIYGFDLRFSDYKLATLQPNIIDSDGNVLQSNVTVNGQTYRAEVCIRYGYLFMHRFFSAEMFIGAGAGYRSFSTLEGYDIRTTTFDDRRLAAERWNHFYFAWRFGIKVGINLL